MAGIPFIKGDESITPEQSMTLAYDAAKRVYVPTHAVNGSKDLGSVSGSVVLDANYATHILSASGPTTVSVGARKHAGQVVTLVVASGGASAIVSADSFPKGDIKLDDQDVVNFMDVRGKWWAFGTGTPPVPDTTPPTAPAITVSSFTDTTVTLAVTRGADAESAPTLYGRYYKQGQAAPAWSAISLSNGAWQVTGLLQQTAYTFEVKETSKGGDSAVASVTKTTDMTHGWALMDKAQFTAADGTAVQGLLTDNGATITSGVDGVVVSNRATVTTAGKATTISFTAGAAQSKFRASSDYTVAASGGANTEYKLLVKGAYPLGAVGFKINGNGVVALDSGSNATWGAAVAASGASLTGNALSGTMTVDYDLAAQTVTCSINGTTVATSTLTSTPAALVGASGAQSQVNNYSGYASTVDNLAAHKWQ